MLVFVIIYNSFNTLNYLFALLFPHIVQLLHLVTRFVLLISSEQESL